MLTDEQRTDIAIAANENLTAKEFLSVIHAAALTHIESLMDAASGTPEGEALDALADLVVVLEKRTPTRGIGAC